MTDWRERRCEERQWSCIIVPFAGDFDGYAERKRWCHKMVGVEKWDVFELRRWYFADADKAMLFKLVWYNVT